MTASFETTSPLLETAWHLQVNFPMTSITSDRVTLSVASVAFIDVAASTSDVSDDDVIVSSLQTKKTLTACATLQSEISKRFVNRQRFDNHKINFYFIKRPNVSI